MNIFEGIFLGVLQGLTEWLPISSSGQSMLVLINLFHVAPGEAFSISAMLHLGSLFAVIFYFRHKLKKIFYEDRQLLKFLIYASLVSGVVGLPVYVGLKDVFSAASGESVTMFIGVMLILTGFILKGTEKRTRKDFDTTDAFFTGGAQGLAVLPGISRSGTTIATLLLRGIEQELALTLSFLLVIPTILGLVTLELIQSGSVAMTMPVFFGVGASFFVSLGVMHYFLTLSRRIDFSLFTIIIGVVAFFFPLLLIVLERLNVS